MRPWVLVSLAALLSVGGLGADRPRPLTSAWQSAVPPLRTFGPQDGPANMTVYTVTEDRAGRLWVGTQDGSALYNGRTWTFLSLPKESASQFIRTLAETPDGSRWFGTEGAGLWRLREGQWTQFAPSNGFPSNTVNSLTQVWDGQGGWSLWATTATGGVGRFDGRQWTFQDTRSGLPSNTVWKIRELTNPDGTRTLWAATTKGFAYFAKDQWHAMGTEEGWPTGESNDIAQIVKPDGRREIWLSFWGRGLFRGDGTTWTPFNLEQKNFPSDFPVQLLIRPNQHGTPMVWASTYDRGIVWWSEGGWRHLDSHQGLPADGVYYIHAPKLGRPTVWLGLRSGGIVGLDLGGWYHVGTLAGLPANEVHAFAETPNPTGEPTLWVGTSEGLAHWEGGQWKVDTTRDGLPSDHITSLLAGQGPGGELWAGTMRGLAKRTSGGRWQTLFATQGLNDQRILCLQDGVDDQGAPLLWAGTEKGLLRLGKEGRTFLTEKEGLPDHRVFSLCRTKDADGRESLWVGTRGGGIGRLRGGVWTHFREAEGLRNMSVFCFREVLAKDGRRWLWAGTFGGGIFRISLDDPEARRWEGFNTENLPGLPSNVVVRIEHDPQKHQLYLATQRGMARLSFQEGAISGISPRVESFSEGDGLSTVSCSYGASILDRQGRVWVATHQGASVLDPYQEYPPPTLPNLIVHQASTHGRPLTLDAKGIRLGHKDNELSFEMSLPTSFHEEDVRFRSQLKGLEDQPTAWTSNARREFGSLPAGSYVLHLEAQDHLGRTAAGLAFPIKVHPAPWLSAWAFTAYVLVIGGLLYLVYRLRTQFLINVNLELEGRVHRATLELQEKNRALEHLNEEKNQFMGIAAHDLKNPLNAVVLASQQIAMGDMEPQELNHFARMIEKAARQMAELIKNMLDVNRMDAGQMQLNIRAVNVSDLVTDVCEEYLPGALAKRQRLLVEPGRKVMAWADALHLRDILENFISNAIKFTPPGPPTRDIVVRVRTEGVFTILEVQDEGPGFTAEDKAKVFGRFERLSARPTGGEGTTGLGLSIVKRLVEAMQGTVTLESEAGQGATFRVSLPQPPPPPAPPV